MQRISAEELHGMDGPEIEVARVLQWAMFRCGKAQLYEPLFKVELKLIDYYLFH